MQKFVDILIASKAALIKLSDFQANSMRQEVLLSLSNTITNQIVETISGFHTITNEIVFNDINFHVATAIGSELASKHCQDTNFFLELQRILHLYNYRAYELIDTLDSSEQINSFAKVFVSLFNVKISQGYITKSCKNIESKFNIHNLSQLPDELTPAYVDEIVKKLANIPMVEICFDGKIMHSNSAMEKLKLSINRDLKIDEIIPSDLQEQVSNYSSNIEHYKSFFSEIYLENRLFQKFVLVLPSTQIYIVFFIEAYRLPSVAQDKEINDINWSQNQTSGLKNVKEAFLANMSHELRTPLHEIIGFADLLSDELETDLSDSQLEYIQLIQQGGERLLELINYLLVVSGKQPQAENFQNCFSGYKFLIELANSVFETTNEKSIAIHLKGDDLGDDLFGDKKRIFLTLSEILSYILKYLISESSITISYISDKHFVSFLIIIPENCNIKFTDEMILSHAMFFIDLMQGKFIVEKSENNEKVFVIKIPHDMTIIPQS